MPAEIRISFVALLPDDIAQEAQHALTIMQAWRTFTEALKACGGKTNEFYVGPAKDQPVRRRRGRPRLVSEPPSAA